MRSALLLLFLAASLGGCTALGPATVVRDRFDYVEAISRSRGEQMLLNLVKIRYAETPMFLEVGQVVSGYNFEGSLGLLGSAYQGDDDGLELGASGKYVERPTITYAPVTGQHFNELLLMPIPPGAVLFLVEAGWSPELVLRMTLDSVNGARNHSGLGWRRSASDPAFERFVEAVGRMQATGSLGIRLARDSQGESSTMLFVHHEHLQAGEADELRQLERELGLQPDLRQLEVVYGPPDHDPTRLAVLTRSLLQVLTEQSAGVELPPGHAGRALEAFHEGRGATPLVRVRSGLRAPADAFTRIRYRDHWYWIDDRDLLSKQVFGFLILLFNVAESGGKSLQPVVTIPA